MSTLPLSPLPMPCRAMLCHHAAPPTPCTLEETTLITSHQTRRRSWAPPDAARSRDRSIKGRGGHTAVSSISRAAETRPNQLTIRAEDKPPVRCRIHVFRISYRKNSYSGCSALWQCIRHSNTPSSNRHSRAASAASAAGSDSRGGRRKAAIPPCRTGMTRPLPDGGLRLTPGPAPSLKQEASEAPRVYRRLKL